VRSKASFAKLRGLLPQPARAYTVEEMNQATQDAAVGKNMATKLTTANK
jgi:hypothetical protein